MSRAHAGGRSSFARGVCGRAVALFLMAAIILGVLPLSVQVPLPHAGEGKSCRFEPIDICGADDTSLGMLADTPVLLAETVGVIVNSAALPAPSDPAVVVREGFAPGVYRPPRPSC